MTDNGVTLTVGDNVYDAWERVSITRHMEGLCGSFELAVTDTPAAPAVSSFPTQARCQVKIGKTSVISGFIDSAGPNTTATSKEIVVRGRDATGDLVDCCYTDGPRQLKGYTFLAATKQLASGFPVGVKVDAVAAAAAALTIANFAVQPSEKVAQAIDRLSRAGGVLTVSDGNGNLVVTRAGGAGANTKLQVGVNCERENFTRDDKGRYSKYLILAQSAGTDFLDLSQFAGAHAYAYDTGVGRYRPLVVVSEVMTPDQGILDTRALWEAARRYGRAFQGEYVVNSWVDAAGNVWTPNSMVELVDPIAQIDETLLIAATLFELSPDGGTRTTLAVTRKEAFLAAPISGLPTFTLDAARAGVLPPLPANIVSQPVAGP